jgi:hypothetical protein
MTVRYGEHALMNSSATIVFAITGGCDLLGIVLLVAPPDAARSVGVCTAVVAGGYSWT